MSDTLRDRAEAAARQIERYVITFDDAYFDQAIVTIIADAIEAEVATAELNTAAVVWSGIIDLIESGTPTDGLLTIARGNRAAIRSRPSSAPKPEAEGLSVDPRPPDER